MSTKKITGWWEAANVAFSGANCIKPISLPHLANKRKKMDAKNHDYNMPFYIQHILNTYSLEEGETDEAIIR